MTLPKVCLDVRTHVKAVTGETIPLRTLITVLNALDTLGYLTLDKE